MKSPYSDLPSSSFWKTAVVGHTARTICGLYQKKFEISPTTKIATAGSCFAQHISRHLRKRNYSLIDLEPPPMGLNVTQANRYGYGLYSARHGNIYTVRQLLQLAQESVGRFSPEFVWENDGRFYDALRPGVEPNGLDSPEEVQIHRAFHLSRFREVLRQADVFIFTLGLTEAWIDRRLGTVFPTAPGTIAGEFNADKFAFKNFNFTEIYSDFLLFRKLATRLKPGIKILLTVSPVPLTATASQAHVLVANTYSKSTLRSVAGQLCQEFDDVDYFPSYELLCTPFLGRALFEPNMRSVSSTGVSAAMTAFLHAHGIIEAAERKPRARRETSSKTPDVICEEALLEAFSK